MMNDLILYLWLVDIINSISFVLILGITVCFGILFSGAIYLFSESYSLSLEDVKHIVNKFGKPTAIALVLMVIILAIIPSKQTMHIALGLHTANQVMQQPQIAQVGNQAMRILQAKLDEYEKELTQENKGEVKND